MNSINKTSNMLEIKPNKLNFQKIQILNDYTLEEKLGEGTFSKVYSGFHNLTKEKVFNQFILRLPSKSLINQNFQSSATKAG